MCQQGGPPHESSSFPGILLVRGGHSVSACGRLLDEGISAEAVGPGPGPEFDFTCRIIALNSGAHSQRGEEGDADGNSGDKALVRLHGEKR